jgi:hypothetical protein
MAPTCEKNIQIKLTPKNFLLIIFNVVYIEVNETRKKLWTDKQYIFKNLLLHTNWHEKHVKHILILYQLNNLYSQLFCIMVSQTMQLI